MRPWVFVLVIAGVFGTFGGWEPALAILVLGAMSVALSESSS